MAIIYLAVTTPDGSDTIKIHPAHVVMPHANLNEAALLTAEIHHDWDVYEDETAADNPVQIGSAIELVRDGITEFKGLIKRVGREQLKNGERLIPIEAADKWEELNYTLAGISTERRFTVLTELLEQADTDMVAGEADEDRSYPYYPTLSRASAWLPISGDGAAPSLELAADIGSGDPNIVLSGDASDWPARGYWCIDAEGGYYDGVHKTSSSPEQWTLRNCIRGSLGTTPAAHLTAEVCYCKIPKRISSSAEIKVEGDTTGSGPWELIGHGQYTVDMEDGCWSFKGDPTALPYNQGAGYSAIRATFTNYDEDNVAAVELADVFQSLLEYAGDGGPAISSGDIDIDIPYLPVTRIRLLQSANTWPVIRQLLAEHIIDRANIADDLAYWYKASTGKYTVKQINQASIPDTVLENTSRIMEEIRADQLCSGVLVGYRSQAPSLFSPTRFYHPDRGDSWGGQVVSAFLYQVADRDMSQGWDEDTSSNGNNIRSDMLCDGNQHTGIGLKFPAATNTNTVMFYCWTPSAESRLTENIKVVLDLRRWIKSTDCIVEVVGFTSYTPGDPPTATGLIHLSDSLRISFSDDQGAVGPGPVERVGMLGGRLVGSQWALTRGGGE